MNKPLQRREFYTYQAPLLDETEHDLFRLSVYGALTRKFIHEINNSLTGIIGYNSLALKHENLGEKEKGYIERTLAFCQTAKSLNESFLCLFPSGKHKRKPVSLHALMEEMSTLVSIISNHHCHLFYQLESSLKDTYIQEKGLREILLYLFLYILDVMLNCENIEMTVSLVKPNGSQRNSEAKQFFLFSIRFDTDTAGSNHRNRSSMNSETIFFQLEGGLSPQLALNNAKNIVESLEGNLSLDPDPSQSRAQFTCLIPLDSLEAQIITPLHTPFTPRSLPALRLLLLEDQALICDFIQSFLQGEGHTLTVYQNGQNLVDDLPNLPLEDFDVFMLDVFVPQISGLEVAKQLRTLRPQAPLLFLSALAEERSVTDLFPLDSHTHFIRKPFQKEELLLILEQMVSSKGYGYESS